MGTGLDPYLLQEGMAALRGEGSPMNEHFCIGYVRGATDMYQGITRKPFHSRAAFKAYGSYRDMAEIINALENDAEIPDWLWEKILKARENINAANEPMERSDEMMQYWFEKKYEEFRERERLKHYDGEGKAE